MMRILQLTDIHISKEGELYDDGINSRKQFLDVLEKAAPQKEDLLVLSGDLCAIDGDLEIYRWIKNQIDPLPCRTLVMAGNHDDSKLMREVFSEESLVGEAEWYGSLIFNETRIHFLDTAPNALSEEQIKWLGEISKSDQGPCLLFIHHPPVPCRPKILDEHIALTNRDKVWPAIKEVPSLRAVFCGHYHSDDHVSVDGIEVYLTPSTALQIEDDNESEKKYKKVHMPGFREIHFKGDQLETAVHYFENL